VGGPTTGDGPMVGRWQGLRGGGNDGGHPFRRSGSRNKCSAMVYRVSDAADLLQRAVESC
jgi:hypothetical protein